MKYLLQPCNQRQSRNLPIPLQDVMFICHTMYLRLHTTTSMASTVSWGRKMTYDGKN
jgi:hypothetical protein